MPNVVEIHVLMASYLIGVDAHSVERQLSNTVLLYGFLTPESLLYIPFKSSLVVKLTAVRKVWKPARPNVDHALTKQTINTQTLVGDDLQASKKLLALESNIRWVKLHASTYIHSSENEIMNM